MPRITVEIPDILHLSLTKTAIRDEVSDEDFILRAIAEKIERLETRNDLYTIADERFARFLKTSETISWADVNTYLERRLAGEMVDRPQPQKFKP